MTKPEHLRQPSETEYLNCIRCGACLAVCPTYREYLNETSSPRGRVALARKGLEGELELSPNLIEQMYACFDCMACNMACPVGIRPADLAIEMRHVQEQINPTGWKETLFDCIISNPARMEVSTWPLRAYERLSIRRTTYVLGLCKLEYVPRRFLPWLRPKPAVCRGKRGNGPGTGPHRLHRDHAKRNRLLRDASLGLRAG